MLLSRVWSLIICLAVPEPETFSPLGIVSVICPKGGFEYGSDLALRSEMSFTRRGIMGKHVQRMTLVTSASLSIC